MSPREPEDAGAEIPYRLMPHTADLALRVSGRDVPALFVNAARALFDVMGQRPAAPFRERKITLDAVDTEALLVDWLNELLFLHETEEETYSDFEIEALTPTRLVARVTGGPAVGDGKLVKAATFHELHITPTAGGVEATIIFDV